MKESMHMVNFSSVDKKRLTALLLIIVFSITTHLNQARADTQYRVGIAAWSGYNTSIQGFKDGMADAGLVEHIHVSYLAGEIGSDKQLQKKVAQEFKRLKVDLVYSLTTPGTAIMKEILPEQMPIVFSIVTYPADSGLIESFEYSGNNLVGTSNFIPLINYISLLNLIQPNVKLVAIFHRKGEPNSNIQAANLIRLLKREGITSINLEPSDINELTQMAMEQVGKVDLFITTTDTLLQGGGEAALIDISLQHKLPILSSNKSGIEQGSTFGPVADFYTLGKMAGKKAAKILLEKISPTRLETELQNPPLFLANKDSLKQLGIVLSNEARDKIILITP
ncbi:ABC transporter substrate-binding protein [Shewanella sp. D64]|uniref:ABC transporter substrate-binding protein n=1 Tax=unclassified Shewanella TaxID=196818 RepID=UPI0022BA5A63|nr:MULTISPECIES: ABC transporter substrate-binding protein [unclassified Shewanella]MEC4726074.1 ABC transporter substrate-binding protein [Shewanella sp. D64]MEC4738009.1 ABC transporter substrate-binding protein [Shewanella sp. E94]WBJ96208.1 ABC transporter substrate-binding protein [Shewanella sp. MTB7]